MNTSGNCFELSYSSDFPISNYFVDRYGIPPSSINTGGEVVKKDFYRWIISNYPDHKIVYTRRTIFGKKAYLSKVSIDIPSIKAVIEFDSLRKKDPIDSDSVAEVYFVDNVLVIDVIANMQTHCLNIQIIATFNTNLKNIDEALLRKGRLIAEHEFKALSKDQANKLLEHLGKKPTATKDMTLTEIYNIEEEQFKVDTKRSPIGFSQR